MTDNVKAELKKMTTAINNGLEFIVDESLPTEELIKLQFSSIRNLVDYCENLALKGEAAIE